MDFAITTDYTTGLGCPEAPLRAIAAAGWRWVHWCHQWDTDFLYARPELEQIERWLAELGLRVLDIHGSAGKEKNWSSAREYERLAGVELVENRVEMAARLGCQVVIMHAPEFAADTPGSAPGLAPDKSGLRGLNPAPGQAVWDRFRRSLDALEPICRRRDVRLAVENMRRDNFDALERILNAYGPDYIGLCYDSGHGQMAGNGLDRLERVLPRLIALHLNDNNGESDLHQPPFMGQVDWRRLAGMLARSGYDRPAMTVEVILKHSGTVDAEAFLRATLQAANDFGAMMDGARRV